MRVLPAGFALLGSLIALAACTPAGGDDKETGPTDADGDGAVAADDCDDGDATAHPGADEVCDGIDNDCDGTVDVAPTDGATYYPDGDADAWGIDAGAVVACATPAGYAAAAGDCNDADASRHPEAEEVCDGIDQDCDGTPDDGASDAPTWYPDVDGDTFGDAAGALASCDPPSGYVDDATDCDDAVASTFPGAEEVCDGVDQDCDHVVDDDASDATTWYRDADDDGFGDPASPLTTCDTPDGYALNASDCDDAHAEASPAGTEVCGDALDNDCDGLTDDATAIDAAAWFRDDDGDEYGDPEVSVLSCTQPSGYDSDNADCDDTRVDVHPGADETCDDADQDCDGDVDEGATDMDVWYLDVDGDGHGVSTSIVSSCDPPVGYAATDDDCFDGSAAVYPGAPELCDDLDNDCDGDIDTDASSWTTWYRDADDDGYGVATPSVEDCAAPVGYADNADDCDDAHAASHPTATEICDGLDNDCDGSVDDGAASRTWYYDGDHDGYGVPSPTKYQCEQPTNYAATADDCDGSDGAVHPGAPESPWDDADTDCDGGNYTLYGYAADPYDSAGLHGVGVAYDGVDVAVGWVADTLSGGATERGGAFVTFDETEPYTLSEGTAWSYGVDTITFEGRSDFGYAGGDYWWVFGAEVSGVDYGLTVWSDGVVVEAGGNVAFGSDVGDLVDANAEIADDGTLHLSYCSGTQDLVGFATGDPATLEVSDPLGGVGVHKSGAPGYDACAYTPFYDGPMASQDGDHTIDYYSWSGTKVVYEYQNTSFTLADLDIHSWDVADLSLAGAIDGLLYLEVSSTTTSWVSSYGSVPVSRVAVTTTSDGSSVAVGTSGDTLSVLWSTSAGAVTETELWWPDGDFDDVALTATDAGRVVVAWTSDDAVYYAVLQAPE